MKTANESISAIRATQREYGLEGDWNLNGVIEFLKNRLNMKAKSNPHWETPEQYKKRTGKPWPDSGAVYTICVKNHREFWYPKSLELVKKVGVPLKNVIIATEAGPPPADWRPEDAGINVEGD
jgi:hypothetical protein